MFGYIHSHAKNINLLEAVPADQIRGYLTRQNYERHGIHKGVRYARNRVRGTGS
ncbi:hypothetical protein D3C75_1308220 [compost metagenome]